jgi:hypothetical protein
VPRSEVVPDCAWVMAGEKHAITRVSAAKTREAFPQERLSTAFLRMKRESTDKDGRRRGKSDAEPFLLKGKVFRI